MNILVLNSGSSSIKYRIYQFPDERLLAAGAVEKIGEDTSVVTHGTDEDQESSEQSVQNHEAGLRLIADYVRKTVLHGDTIQAVGHRVVHGGEHFSQPTIISDEVLEKIEQLATLAPLHNPPNALGIQVAREVFPNARQVAVFDTAFHQSLSPHVYRYALPNALYENHRIRVYGMHGTSHQYVAEQAAHYLGRSLEKINLISIHLGNGCSMTAIRNGKSVDTSMGFSPLAGLMMGTRSGDIDPSIPYFLGTQAGMSFDEIDQLLNHASGLKGITGENDVRAILDKQSRGSREADLALEMYTYRIKKYIGAYLAVLGHVDAVIFTAGVGENSAFVREKSVEGLTGLGITLDQARNQQRSSEIREIQSEQSRTKILVIPTNEELSIAQQSFALLAKKND